MVARARARVVRRKPTRASKPVYDNLTGLHTTKRALPTSPCYPSNLPIFPASRTFRLSTEKWPRTSRISPRSSGTPGARCVCDRGLIVRSHERWRRRRHSLLLLLLLSPPSSTRSWRQAPVGASLLAGGRLLRKLPPSSRRLDSTRAEKRSRRR